MPRRQWRFIATMIFLVSVISASEWLAYVPNSPTANRSAYQSSQSSAPKSKRDRIVDWAINDPNMFFSGVVALFTVVLAISTVGLWTATLMTGRRQREDMTGLITATASQAESMGQLHAAAKAQERAMRDHVVATLSLTQHIPQIERAYISGGGPLETQIVGYQNVAPITIGAANLGGGTTGVTMVPTYAPTGNFVLQINNHGKTPGNLLEFGIGFCEATNIPNIPVYHWAHWPDWIGPGTQSRPIVPVLIPPNLTEPVIFGRLRYTDIFGAGHSSGFILRIIRDRGTEPILAPEAYTESD